MQNIRVRPIIEGSLVAYCSVVALSFLFPQPEPTSALNPWIWQTHLTYVWRVPLFAMAAPLGGLVAGLRAKEHPMLHGTWIVAVFVLPTLSVTAIGVLFGAIPTPDVGQAMDWMASIGLYWLVIGVGGMIGARLAKCLLSR